MKLSKREIDFFSSPESLIIPLSILMLYTGPTCYAVSKAIIDGCFWDRFGKLMWFLLLWGGSATFFAIYFAILFFIARKQKKNKSNVMSCWRKSYE